MTRLPPILALALAAQTTQIVLVRVDLVEDDKGQYPAITSGPVICGDRILMENEDYWIDGQRMIVACPPSRGVWTYSAVVVETPKRPVTPVQRRKP